MLTGYNEAFIVSSEVRDQLVAEDPASVRILKPILQGRDIRPYRAHWAGLWLIATFPSLSLVIDQYPAIKQHLLSFGRRRLQQSGRVFTDGTRGRKRTPHAWYELQDTCAYHEQFEQEKLCWMHMSPVARFAFVESGVYCNQKAFMVVGKDLKYLCAVLNTRAVTRFVGARAVTTGMGLTQWDKFVVEGVPIPRANSATQARLARLVDAEAEDEIEQLVSDLYRFDESERQFLKPSTQ